MIKCVVTISAFLGVAVGGMIDGDIDIPTAPSTTPRISDRTERLPEEAPSPVPADRVGNDPSWVHRTRPRSDLPRD